MAFKFYLFIFCKVFLDGLLWTTLSLTGIWLQAYEYLDGLLSSWSFTVDSVCRKGINVEVKRTDQMSFDLNVLLLNLRPDYIHLIAFTVRPIVHFSYPPIKTF